MSKVKLATAALAIIVLIGAFGRNALADSHTDQPMSVLLIDRQALAESKDGTNLIESLTGLISALKKGEYIAFLAADSPSQVFGPVRLGGPGYPAFLAEMRASLAAPPPDGRFNAAGALMSTYDLLSASASAPGSTVYLLAGGADESRVPETSNAVKVVAGLLNRDGWPVYSLSLADTSAEMRDFLTVVSNDSGGEVVRMAGPEGLRKVTNDILSSQAKGSLTSFAGAVMTPTDVLSSTLDVLPGTSEATLIFFKEDPFGSLRLSNPSGLEASVGDRALSSVTESPFAVVWRLEDPVPGQWRIDVRGVSGPVTAWHSQANKFTLELLSYASVPVDQTTALMAFVGDQGNPVTLDGVTVLATLTTPQGDTLVHELNDAGVRGDAVPGDGYFTSTLAPLGTEGTYDVDLELQWPGLDHTITSQGELTAQPFPTVVVTRGQTEELNAGQRSLIASVEILVQGHPYVIATNEITAEVSSNASDAGTVEVVPRRLVSAGEAWEYDVYFTPALEANHALILGLDMEYGGRDYVKSDIVTMSSLPSHGPIIFGPGRIPWIVPATPFLLALGALLGLVIFGVTRTRPFGYLYNDSNQLIVDFSAIKPKTLLGFLSKNRVSGRDLSLKGLENVSFNFSGKDVGLQATGPATSIRVNNQPLVDEVPVRDRSWIGAQGRLYSFFLSPLTMDPDPGLADD